MPSRSVKEIRLAQGPSSWFYGVALAWCDGESIQSVSSGIEIGEGDIVSILNKTVDLLDELRSLLARYGDLDMLDTTARRAGCSILGIVAMLRTDG